jgi:cyclophilin family peptidyl-prolyl cis-trans isomerase
MFKINLRKLILPFIAISVAIACGSTKNSISESKSLEVNEAKNNNLYIISTKFGDMKIKLLDETPLHRDNFKKLVADSFYDGTLFHRVIDGFMIQGGDPSSKNAKPGQQLGTGNIEYTIPAEFNSKLIHKKGALAAARQSDAVNPDKESSGCQFYIVDGNKVNERALKSISSRKDIMRKRTLGTKVLDNPSNAQLKKDFIRVRQKGLKDSINFYGAIIQDQIDTLYNGSKFKYTPQQIALYDSIGGTPALDMDYTVFGEVIEGLNIIDSISIQQKDRMNRPFDDVKMTIKKL